MNPEHQEEIQMLTPINNALNEHKDKPEIKVGDPVTALYWSDRCAYYVSKIISPCKIEVQRAECTMKAGTTYYDQEYDIKPNPNGERRVLIKTKAMRYWKEYKSRSTTTYKIGCASEYRDPYF